MVMQFLMSLQAWMIQDIHLLHPSFQDQITRVDGSEEQAMQATKALYQIHLTRGSIHQDLPLEQQTRHLDPCEEKNMS